MVEKVEDKLFWLMVGVLIVSLCTLFFILGIAFAPILTDYFIKVGVLIVSLCTLFFILGIAFAPILTDYFIKCTMSV
jgi:hypothetical protein